MGRLAQCAALCGLCLGACAVDAPPESGGFVDPRADHDAPLLPECVDEYPYSMNEGCEYLPHFCGLPVESVIGDPRLDLETAVDVVFVGDGFTEDVIDVYRGHVDNLIDSLLRDENGFVARDPTLFNFHRVDIISDPSAAETPFRSCARGPDRAIVVDEPAVATAARSAPDADVVVLIPNSWDGRSNANTLFRHVHLALNERYVSLTHELAHVVFGLADEYVERPACFPYDEAVASTTIDPFVAPNVTADPTGAKWQDLVGTPPVAGGMKYAECIYHPTESCPMGSALGEIFCPVCSDAIARGLAIRRDPSIDDGPPTCGIEALFAPFEAFDGGFIRGVGRDLNGLSDVTIYFDGEPQPPEICAGEESCGTGLLLEMRERSQLFLDTNLAPGEHEVRVTCTDTLGNTTDDTVTIRVPERPSP
jgi:hypothetical protein